MSNRPCSVEIEETDNGWIVSTSFFCYGGEQRRVFMEWEAVMQFVTESLRAKP